MNPVRVSKYRYHTFQYEESIEGLTRYFQYSLSIKKYWLDTYDTLDSIFSLYPPRIKVLSWYFLNTLLAAKYPLNFFIYWKYWQIELTIFMMFFAKTNQNDLKKGIQPCIEVYTWVDVNAFALMRKYWSIDLIFVPYWASNKLPTWYFLIPGSVS